MSRRVVERRGVEVHECLKQVERDDEHLGRGVKAQNIRRVYMSDCKCGLEWSVAPNWNGVILNCGYSVCLLGEPRVWELGGAVFSVLA